MSVYKEGYHIISKIEANSKQVFDDACDYGAPVYKNTNSDKDVSFGNLKQLVDWYSNYFDEQENNMVKFPVNKTAHSVSTKIQLLDEWAVSDDRKTEEEATDTYEIFYMSLKNFKNKPYIRSEFNHGDVVGFVTVTKIEN